MRRMSQFDVCGRRKKGKREGEKPLLLLFSLRIPLSDKVTSRAAQHGQ